MSSKIFLIAGGSESKESDRKLYIGVGPVYVVDVNPDRTVLSKFFGYDASDPEYVGVSEADDTAQVRIDFLVASDPKTGVEMKTKVSFFLKNAIRYNKDNSKVQVIDKYGRTAWATVEEAKAKVIPQYSSGPANIDIDYRPAYVGEEELTGFIRAYLNIPNPSYAYKDKKTNELVTRVLPNPDDALLRLDKIEKYFKGDFKELKSIPKLQPKNTVKAMFGVRTTEDGRQFQAVYTQKFLKTGITDYSRLDAELQDRKNNGAYASVEFDIKPLREYKVESTDFSSPQRGNTPFSEPMDDNPWFMGN